MYVNKDSTQGGLWQAKEGIVYPKGKEEDEGKISDSQVEHVDVGVCPGVPFGNEGTQGSSIDKKTQEKQRRVSQTLEGVHSASSTGDVGGVAAHTYL